MPLEPTLQKLGSGQLIGCSTGVSLQQRLLLVHLNVKQRHRALCSLGPPLCCLRPLLSSLQLLLEG